MRKVVEEVSGQKSDETRDSGIHQGRPMVE